MTLILFKNKVIISHEENSFIEDVSIGKNGIDKLGYQSYSRSLAEKILNSNFEKSFAIGVNGKWGLGKTSFFDLIKRNIHDKDIIEIDFNAWTSHTPQGIIRDFFDVVQEKLKPYHSNLSRLLIQYSSKLVSLNSNDLTNSLHTSVMAVTGLGSTDKLYDEIDQALRQINKKLIIFIDDLDRLNQDEAIEVIRLIRNTANFHNTCFIVAYDRDYLVKALQKLNDYKSETYLEKIFQLEISLPYFDKKILREELATILKRKLPQELHRSIDEDIIGTISMTPAILNDWLENMRDVTRLANAIILNLSKLNGEVVFWDFIRIELLRQKFPSAYDILFRKSDEFLEVKSMHYHDKHQYILKTKNEQRGFVQNIQKEDSLYFEYLRANQENLSIPENDLEKIFDLVSGIFQYSNFSYKSHLSIVIPSKFHRYSHYQLFSENLSEIEFSDARDSNYEEFIKKLGQWVDSGLEGELGFRFSQIRDFDDTQDFEKVISAIFYLANQKSQIDHNIRYCNGLVFYNTQDLIYKLSNPENLVSKFYPDSNGSERLKSFVKERFVNAQYPYFFESEVLKTANKQFSHSFILTKEEINQVNFDYLKSYCNKTDKLDSNFWHLYRNCLNYQYISTGSNTFKNEESVSPEVKEITKDFFLNKDLDGFISAIIETSIHTKGRFQVSNFVLEIFKDWDSFEKELGKVNIKKSRYIEEFVKLYEKFKASNYSGYIDFDFHTIQIKNK